ncbi:MAG: cytochrome C oxidase subunit IV family protein [Planctomycetota bacterium]|nr:cytochrome C oxidase subunit IV family protein [Planctomycetota bacterium]
MSNHDSHEEHCEHKGPHVVSLGLLATVLIVLLGLTGLTVVTGKMDLHGFDLAVAMLIATVKASIVCLIFMHLYWDRKFNGMIFLFAVMLLGLFLAFGVLDLGQYQANVDAYRADQIQP